MLIFGRPPSEKTDKDSILGAPGGRQGISSSTFMLQFVEGHKFAARNFGLIFLDSFPIFSVQRLLAFLEQKPQKTAGQRPVCFRQSVDQAVQVFPCNHVFILSWRATMGVTR